jgi:hypothetical protein
LGHKRVKPGVKGGLAGAVAMALLAMLYGIISHGSIWYPINLLAGSLYAPSATPSVEEMLHFQLGWFFFALALHIATSLLVGLLYGAMLPMLPNRPILLGSPLDTFSGFVLTAHMLQHMLLMMVAPPLILLGAPLIPIVRGLPIFAAREFAGPFLNWSVASRIGHTLTNKCVPYC